MSFHRIAHSIPELARKTGAERGILRAGLRVRRGGILRTDPFPRNILRTKCACHCCTLGLPYSSPYFSTPAELQYQYTGSDEPGLLGLRVTPRMPCSYVAVAMCMQVHDNANKISTIPRHAVSHSCNHPNVDRWPVLSTGRRDAERARPRATFACCKLMHSMGSSNTSSLC